MPVSLLPRMYLTIGNGSNVDDLERDALVCLSTAILTMQDACAPMYLTIGDGGNTGGHIWVPLNAVEIPLAQTCFSIHHSPPPSLLNAGRLCSYVSHHWRWRQCGRTCPILCRSSQPND